MKLTSFCAFAIVFILLLLWCTHTFLVLTVGLKYSCEVLLFHLFILKQVDPLCRYCLRWCGFSVKMSGILLRAPRFYTYAMSRCYIFLKIRQNNIWWFYCWTTAFCICKERWCDEKAKPLSGIHLKWEWWVNHRRNHISVDIFWLNSMYFLKKRIKKFRAHHTFIFHT